MQTFEARFYAPWLAACVGLCNCLLLRERYPSSWLVGLMATFFSVLLCLIHSFGVFTLALIAGFHGLFQWRRPGVLVSTVLLLLPGPAVLVCCFPMYQGQRAVLAGETWVPDPGLAEALLFGRESYNWALLTLAAVHFSLETILRRPGEEPPSSGQDGRGFRLLAGAFGLLFWPLVLILFRSWRSPP